MLRARIVAEPFSAYPVCDGDIDHVLGYVDAKEMFQRVLSGQPLAFDQGLHAAQGAGHSRPALADRGARAVPARRTKTSRSSSTNTAWWWA